GCSLVHDRWSQMAEARVDIAHYMFPEGRVHWQVEFYLKTLTIQLDVSSLQSVLVCQLIGTWTARYRAVSSIWLWQGRR
ncbi:unnamed protein product, partial [Musa acuminata subsp. burmannicoides]